MSVVSEILETSTESRLIVWHQNSGVGYDAANIDWLDRVFRGKPWREVVIPNEDSLVEWLLYVPLSVLPRAIPAILDFCCKESDQHDVPLELLLAFSRYGDCPRDWDAIVLEALKVYLKVMASASMCDRLKDWFGDCLKDIDCKQTVQFRLEAVRRILHDSPELRKIEVPLDPASDLNQTLRLKVEQDFEGKAWRQILLSHCSLEWLIHIRPAMLPRIMPAILDFCCGAPQYHDLPLEALLFFSRTCDCPTDWDSKVVEAMRTYLAILASQEQEARILAWFSRAVV